jgi:purine-binding chemotaxis protein CheW
MSATQLAVEQSQYLSFFLAGEEYALGILKVKEIIEYDTLTCVPRTPPFIRGVINLRGSVVPVIDLAVKFGMQESLITKWTCIVIVEINFEDEQIVMGILVDSISQVIDLLPDDIEVPPSFGTKVDVDYLLGMGRLGKKFVLILDIDRVLSGQELQTAVSVHESEPAEASLPEREALTTEDSLSAEDSAMEDEESLSDDHFRA